MNKIEKEVLNEYARDYSVEATSYEAMGKMLDERYVEERLKAFDINEMYIYGGTYLAIQLYRVGKKYTNIKGIVDRSGKIIMNENIFVVTLDEFKKIYKGEKIIVTPIRYFPQIQNDLTVFVDKKDIISIGELLMGLV